MGTMCTRNERRARTKTSRGQKVNGGLAAGTAPKEVRSEDRKRDEQRQRDDEYSRQKGPTDGASKHVVPPAQFLRLN
jgi:hypothetical protein